MNVEVTAIKPRVSGDGHPFCEVLYSVADGGRVENYCSRLWYPLTDTPHTRVAERAAFIKRQQKVPGC